MKLKLFIILIFIAKASLFYSQNFEKGYVINNQNDTIHGLIAVKNNNTSSKKCKFKTEKTDKIITYTPDDIRQFRYQNGKYYISSRIPNDSTNQLHFLEFLVDGIVDLYYYQDNINEYYFIKDINDSLVELKNTQYYEKIENTTYLRNKNEYIQILAPILQNSTKSCEKLMRTQVDYKSLISLIQFYHKDLCTQNECIVYSKQIKKEKFHFGVVAAYESMQIKDITTPRVSGVLYEYNTVYYPKLGIFIYIPLSFINNQRSRLIFENTYSVEKQNNQLSYPDGYYSYQIQMKENRFNMRNNLYFSYDLSRTTLRPLILGGIFLKTTLDSELKTQVDVYNPNNMLAITKLETTKTNYMNMEAGAFVGLGLHTKVFKIPFSFDLRCSYGSGLGSDAKFKATYFSANLGIILL